MKERESNEVVGARNDFLNSVWTSFRFAPKKRGLEKNVSGSGGSNNEVD
jgi:hypothetical protein